MPDRGTSQALNFALPENRYIQTQAAPVAAPQEAVNPLPSQMGNDSFAYVEGITDKFYNLKGQVEKYALDMSKKYGVDVTQPDYTQPGGGILFKTYQKLATDLMLTANDLKESQKVNTLDTAAERAGQITRQEGFDPTQQLSSRASTEERLFTNTLLPEVEQANRLAQTQVHTKADHDRMTREVINPTIEKINARTDLSEQQKQFNINALMQQVQTTPYAAFQAGRGSKSTVEIDILKDITNTANGIWKPGTFKSGIDDNGNPILVNKKREGEQYGEFAYTDDKGNQKRVPRIIDRWVKDESGNVRLEFKNREGVDIPSEAVSGIPGDVITSNFISSNPKYGSAPKMYEAARELGLLDDSSSAINERLFSQETSSPDLSQTSQAVKEAKEELGKRLDEYKGSGFGQEGISIPLPGGTILKLFKHKVGSGWYIEQDGEQISEDHLKKEDVIGQLVGAGAIDSALDAINNKQTPAGVGGLAGVTPDLPPLPNETQAAYDLRKIRAKRK